MFSRPRRAQLLCCSLDCFGFRPLPLSLHPRGRVPRIWAPFDRNLVQWKGKRAVILGLRSLAFVAGGSDAAKRSRRQRKRSDTFREWRRTSPWRHRRIGCDQWIALVPPQSDVLRLGRMRCFFAAPRQTVQGHPGDGAALVTAPSSLSLDLRSLCFPRPCFAVLLRSFLLRQVKRRQRWFSLHDDLLGAIRHSTKVDAKRENGEVNVISLLRTQKGRNNKRGWNGPRN
jgi:hypothetical protein